MTSGYYHCYLAPMEYEDDTVAWKLLGQAEMKIPQSFKTEVFTVTVWSSNEQLEMPLPKTRLILEMYSMKTFRKQVQASAAEKKWIQEDKALHSLYQLLTVAHDSRHRIRCFKHANVLQRCNFSFPRTATSITGINQLGYVQYERSNNEASLTNHLSSVLSAASCNNDFSICGNFGNNLAVTIYVTLYPTATASHDVVDNILDLNPSDRKRKKGTGVLHANLDRKVHARPKYK